MFYQIFQGGIMLGRWLTCLGLALALGNAIPVAAQDASQAVDTSCSVVNTYCVTCHNQTLKTAGLLLDTMDITNPACET